MQAVKERSPITSGCTSADIRKAPSPNAGLFVGLAFCLLAGYLLFCHGCHADEDTELMSSGILEVYAFADR